MAANNNRLHGLSIVGLMFAMNGVVFLIVGHVAIGVTQLGAGMALFAAAVAAARQTTRPEADHFGCR
jgi:hypothetical protein